MECHSNLKKKAQCETLEVAVQMTGTQKCSGKAAFGYDCDMIRDECVVKLRKISNLRPLCSCVYIFLP